MSERRGWRGFGRRRAREASDAATGANAGAAEVPCAPCAKQASLRAFSLNPPTAASITDELVPVLRDGLADAILASEVVLFDPVDATSTLLNPSAALIWASIDGRATVATIIDELVADTGADRATIDADVRSTIARFQVAGIVERPERAPVDDLPVAPPAATSPDDAAAAARRERRDRRARAVLDRTGWAPGAGPRRCGAVAVEVRADDPEVATAIRPALEALAPSPPPGLSGTISVVDRRVRSPRRYRILVGTETRNWAATPDDAVRAVFSELNDLASGQALGHLVLHAGAVARGDATVVVAGPSGRGKSTLTAALVRRGFDYLTDEVVALDPATGTVRAYPKPLDLDARALDLLGLDEVAPPASDHKAGVAPERLGRSRSDDGRVALLVLLRDPDAPAAGAPPTPAQSLVELLTNTFAATFDPSSTLDDPLGHLAALVQTVPVLHLDRMAPGAAADAVASRLDEITGGVPAGDLA
jgi:hypothetical protein